MNSPCSLLLTRRWPRDAEEALARSYDVQLNREDRPMSAAALAGALRKFDFVCPTVTDRIDAAMLSARPLRARALCTFGAGVDNIDLEACAAAGLIVTNTPDVLTDDTADLAILLALMCARRAGEGERLVRSGGWNGWAPTDLLGTSLSGKTMGIVGFGRIGQATALRARRGFGMRILYFSPRRAPEKVERELAAEHVPFDRLLADADVVSLHVPGGGATRHLLNGARLSLMKPSAILVNTARGDVVDEDALITALGNRRIACAGLDVYSNEPHVAPALRRLENVVLLPHLGSATRETRTAMGLRVARNIDAIAAGRAPPDRVA